MPLNQDQVLAVVQEICTQRDLQVTFTESLKAGATVGACTFGGALLGGPIGIGIGAALGSVLAMRNGQGKFKSVVTVMREMTPAQKDKMVRSLNEVFASVDTQDVLLAVSMVMTSNNLQALFISELRKFMRSEMGLRLL